MQQYCIGCQEDDKFRAVRAVFQEGIVRGIAITLGLVCLQVMLSSTVQAQFGSATRPQVAMPDGPVRNIILKNCVACHGIDDYAFHALTRERWTDLIEERHEGLEMTRMSRRDRNTLLDYLVETFSEENTPFPRQYVPPEIDTYYEEEQGLLVLDTMCTECHALDRVYETRGSIERWRVLLLEMRGRGAFFESNEDMERMAEWLSRVQSANLFE